ncbi:hypothetical protein [Reyranella soli]|nr:hypothetical protein [Reyranella soli]
MDDYDALVALFDELDEFQRLARPDVFRRFDGPARTRRQIEEWLTGVGSTVLVAELDRIRGGRGRAMSAWPCTPSIEMRADFTNTPALHRRSID